MVFKEVTTESQYKEVLKSTPKFFVYFWSPTCPPCRAFAPTVKEYFEKSDKTLLKIDVNVPELESIVDNFVISTIPHLAFVKDGKQVGDKLDSSKRSVAGLDEFVNSSFKSN